MRQSQNQEPSKEGSDPEGDSWDLDRGFLYEIIENTSPTIRPTVRSLLSRLLEETSTIKSKEDPTTEAS